MEHLRGTILGIITVYRERWIMWPYRYRLDRCLENDYVEREKEALVEFNIN